MNPKIPASQHFAPVSFRGNTTYEALSTPDWSEHVIRFRPQAPCGAQVFRGIPFKIPSRVVQLLDKPVTIPLHACKAPWLVFLHTADRRPPHGDIHGFTPHSRGVGRLNETLATYTFQYADGTGCPVPVRGRFEIGMVERPAWGENAFSCVPHVPPMPVTDPARALYGQLQTHIIYPDHMPWINWLWAWQNPHPDRPLESVRLEPGAVPVLVMGITAGNTAAHPLRWGTRQKVVITVPDAAKFNTVPDGHGCMETPQIDLGTIIHAEPVRPHDNPRWEQGLRHQPAAAPDQRVLVEYYAHPEACFVLSNGTRVPIAGLTGKSTGVLQAVKPARQRVTLRILDDATGQTVPAKIHVHGEAGEYLTPMNRQRHINNGWYEDHEPEYSHAQFHATYMDGEADIQLPLGKVYIEVSRGFEIKPLRKVLKVTAATRRVTLKVERVLPWRERGWVTADTHVHFLSPHTALLEGACEDVNVVNLLAAQWGELMTNTGDFDGRTLTSDRRLGGEGRHMVRVGTENRQHVLGHISLLGYNGRPILPLSTGGHDEGALGECVDVLLIEWARQCRKQGGLVVVPHFPNPRAEHAAAIIDGQVDAVEMTCWDNLFGGIDPYSLSDWYRYLNCGYFVAAVGGSDKMSAAMPVGGIRTYAQVGTDGAADYEAWKAAVRRGHTFVTYGPLMEFSVEGQPAGSRIHMGRGGGTVSIEWKAASCVVPMTRVELLVNGEIRESVAIGPEAAQGQFRLRVARNSWAALMIRAKYPWRDEMIGAHSSPVMLNVPGTRWEAAADALTILEQIEGALAYLDTVGPRAEMATYKRMRLQLVAVHRKLHNQMHAAGHYHAHNHATDHPEHHH